MVGDYYELVLHIYATGSQIDATVKMQNKTAIAASSEDEVDAADADDPNPADGGDDDDDDFDSVGDSTNNATTSGATNGATDSGSAAPAAAAPAAPIASVVKTSSTFNYIACEADSSTSRTLSSLSWSGTNLTVERCAAYCSQYKYMGVEFGSQ